MARIEEIIVSELRLPLTTPYKVSRKTFDSFDPIVLELRTGEATGWGEAVISPGYADETPESGWAYLSEMSPRLLGRSLEEAKAMLAPTVQKDSHAASILLTACEMAERNPLLQISKASRLPLLTPVNAMTPGPELEQEIEGWIAQSYRTLKVKVGFAVEPDLARVAAIQRIVGTRATLRLDANQGFTPEDGKRFAEQLDPAGIELFEQPCNKADWAANAAVAAVSTVPVMLDESIYGLEEISRAANIQGVGYVKLKLKKFGSLQMLDEGLAHAQSLGLRTVCGDGTATDISCWMEAAIGLRRLKNAGENNGFLKLRRPLFATELPFRNGAIELPAGWWPEIDRQAVEDATLRTMRHAPAAVGLTA